MFGLLEYWLYHVFFNFGGSFWRERGKNNSICGTQNLKLVVFSGVLISRFCYWWFYNPIGYFKLGTVLIKVICVVIILSKELVESYLHNCERDVITMECAIEIASAVILFLFVWSSLVGVVDSPLSSCVSSSESC